MARRQTGPTSSSIFKISAEQLMSVNVNNQADWGDDQDDDSADFEPISSGKPARNRRNRGRPNNGSVRGSHRGAPMSMRYGGHGQSR
jgi:hypothetical protein